MRTVYLTERQIELIREGEEEVTFYEFFTEIKNYLKKLLSDPIEAKPSKFFSSNGISKTQLLNKMLQKGIITKKEDIKEPNDAEGKMTSMHYIQYSIPRKNFEQKIKRLYSYFFENGKKKALTENAQPNKYDSVATYIFCRNKEGEICVLGGKRIDYNNGGKYNVPTGHVGDHNPNENVLDAAVREVAEESDLLIPKGLFKFAGDEPYESRFGKCLGANYVVMFNDTTEEHRTGMGDGENERFHWIPLSKIDNLNWAFGMNNTIKQMVQKYINI